MKYELIQERNKQLSLLLQVLTNRGIKNVEGYLHTDDSYILDPLKLDNMSGGVRMFLDNQKKKSKVFLLVDSDTDGYTSAAVIYNYAYRMWPDWVESNWTYYLHETKTHGLKDCIDKILEENYDFILIPDAGSNDYEEIETLYFKNKDVLILDHHEAEKTTNKAVVINNQLCSYPTKSLTGAGIVYKFCQRLDSVLNVEIADCFLDLVVAGLIADVADLRDLETHRIVEKGLLHIYSPLLQTIIDKNDYTLKGKLNPKGISFSVAPIINSITRIGTLEERELIFKAMIEQDETFVYDKRGVGLVEENIYDRAARIAKNAKSRQDKQRDKVFNELKGQANPNDKVIFLESKQAQSGLVGLSAMKLADTLRRPVIIVKEITKDGEPILSGSCRNYDGSPISNLKDLILKTNSFIFCSGHGNAAGLAIKRENVDEAKNKFKELLQNVDFNPSIPCDFIFDIDEFDIGFIQTIDKYGWLWGACIKEPKVAIENIVICREDIHVQGKNFNSISFMNNNIKFVKFNMNEDDPLLEWASAWDGEENDKISINVVGTVGINEYQGIYIPQVVIEDSEIV